MALRRVLYINWRASVPPTPYVLALFSVSIFCLALSFVSFFFTRSLYFPSLVVLTQSVCIHRAFLLLARARAIPHEGFMTGQ